MNKTISIWIQRVLVLGALALASPSIAEACACCDGHAERSVVGWSASGRSALIRHRAFGCTDTHSLEILRAGQDQPVGCFDVYSVRPDRRVACDALMPGYERFPPDGRPTNSPRAADYAGVAQEVDAAHVRATLHRAGADSRQVEIRVEVRGTGSWTEIHRQELLLGRPEHGADLGNMPAPEDARLAEVPQPIEVHVWPSPDGERALVEVGGYNVDPPPGIGLYSETMHWVRIPSGLPLVVGRSNLTFASAGGTLRRSDWMDLEAAHRINRFGLLAHGRGEFADSARLFATALLVAPTHVGAQYNLACAYARLGQDDQAVQLLRELAERGCSRCRRKLARAQRDEDLRSIRQRLPRGTAP